MVNCIFIEVKQLSFSADVKKEILAVHFDNNQEKVSRLYGIVRFGANLLISSDKKINFNITTDSAAFAREIFSLCRQTYGFKLDMAVSSHVSRRKKIYRLHPDELEGTNILTDLGILNINTAGGFAISDSIPEYILEDIDCRKAFISGAFLSSGSVTNPNKSYHMEFSIHNYNLARQFSKSLHIFDVKSSVIEKNDDYICYIKESESISNVLNIVGAHAGLFKFEDVRIKKQMRNDVNRIVNCETSNLDRLVKASVRQKQAIEYIKNTKGLDVLKGDLYELAKLRYENPEMSLTDLAKGLSKPITKSGVNYRLLKIEKIADKIKEEEDAIK